MKHPQFFATNLHGFRLQLLEWAFDPNQAAATLRPIADAIREVSATVNSVTDKADDGEADSFIDAQCEMIESYLGCAFVISQTMITRVVSRVIALHEGAAADNVNLTTTGRTKWDIMGFGSRLIRATAFTRIQVMDAFANYFKHESEWRQSWSNLGGQQQKTIAVMRAAGANAGSTGNFRSGARALGNRSFDRLDLHLKEISSWHKGLVRAYTSEFRRVGLAR